MLKFMFLGTNGSIQEQDQGNTSLLFKGTQGRAVVDLSCNLATVVREDIDAVIFTHEHIDHVYGLPSLLHQMWLSGRKKPLVIYAPEGMHPFIDRFLDLFSLRQKNAMFQIHLCAQSQFRVGTMQFTLFPTDHTSESVGMVVQDGEDKLVYTSDTRPIREPLPEMQGAHILIHEASGVSEDEDVLSKKGHSSGRDAGRLAKALQVSVLYLCHLPVSEKERIIQEASEYCPRTILAEPLKELC